MFITATTTSLLSVYVGPFPLYSQLLDLGTVSAVLASCMDPPSNDAIERTLFFLIDIMAIACLHKKIPNFYHESDGQKNTMILGKSTRKMLRNRLKQTSKAYNAGDATALDKVINT